MRLDSSWSVCLPPTVPEFADLLRALNNEHVRYVVVGGLAMILQGSSYVTFDLDFAISKDDNDPAAVVRALAPFRPFPPRYGSPEHFVWDERSLTISVVDLITDAGQVDILRLLPGVDSFEGLWSRSELRTLAGLEIRVASIDDLIAMKTAASRPKDLDHIRQLIALKNLRS